MTTLKLLTASLITLSSIALAAPQGFGPAAGGGGAGAGPSGFGGAGAGPGGFNNAAPNTVAAVKNNAYDDQVVRLRGRLTNYLGQDKYEFSDGSGSITVELDDDRPWSHIGRGQLIDIVGEVDRDMFRVQIDVKQATPAGG